MKQRAWWLPIALLAACGTVESGPAQDLAIRAATLPLATVGFRYDDQNVVIQLERGTGTLTWSLPLLPPQLAGWLSINPDTGQLLGLPLDLVSPPESFVVQVTNGSGTAQAQFSLGVGCKEGVRSPCPVPDSSEPRCLAGSRLCQAGVLGTCVADVGGPPYEGDTSHCGAGCGETCSRTSTNRCVGVCACGSAGVPCSGEAPACCPGTDGRPESFACVSLQTPEHCGSCQTACAARPQTTAACASSACRYPCVPPYQNCNGGGSSLEGADADGCETRVDNDLTNCGACGKRCPASLPAAAHAAPGAAPTCAEGGCRYACSLPRFHDCSSGTCREFTTDLDPDGCETDFSSVNSCGGKGIVCTTSLAHADPICALDTADGRYRCGVQCRDGYVNPPGGGVCVPLSDPSNCGACGRACPTINDSTEQQYCSTSGQCCTQACDPANRPPCGPVICR